MNIPKHGEFMVLCREDGSPDGKPGKYVLATSRTFPTVDKAHYWAKSINRSRRPLIVYVERDVYYVEETTNPHGWEDPEPADYDPLFGKPLT